MRGIVLTISTWAGAAAADEIAGVVIHGPPAPVAPAGVTRDENGGAAIRAVRLDAPLVVDGRLDERIYEIVPAIGGFLQQDPNAGFPATEETDVSGLLRRGQRLRERPLLGLPSRAHGGVAISIPWDLR